MMLSSIVPEVTVISQHCQKGVTGHNKVYASEWLGGLWRTKGSDFESLVYMSRLVFRVPHLNITSDYHLEI